MVDDPRARVGTVASIQTLGSYGANFHPHVHALVTEGAFHPSRDGTPSFESVPWWHLPTMTELFRRLVLRELRLADRLRGETEGVLLSWHHSGFSVHATEPILPDDTGRQEHLARYITCAPLRIDAVEFAQTGQVKIRTPFDPRSGQRELFLDELELIRRLCAQIPAPRQHMVRYFGYDSNRSRGARGETATEAVPTVDDSPTERARRRSWLRLLKRVFEVDPLLCPRCQVEMKFVAVIQDFSVVDRILDHLRCSAASYPPG